MPRTSNSKSSRHSNKLSGAYSLPSSESSSSGGISPRCTEVHCYYFDPNCPPEHHNLLYEEFEPCEAHKEEAHKEKEYCAHIRHTFRPDYDACPFCPDFLTKVYFEEDRPKKCFPIRWDYEQEEELGAIPPRFNWATAEVGKTYYLGHKEEVIDGVETTMVMYRKLYCMHKCSEHKDTPGLNCEDPDIGLDCFPMDEGPGCGGKCIEKAKEHMDSLARHDEWASEITPGGAPPLGPSADPSEYAGSSRAGSEGRDSSSSGA